MPLKVSSRLALVWRVIVIYSSRAESGEWTCCVVLVVMSRLLFLNTCFDLSINIYLWLRICLGCRADVNTWNFEVCTLSYAV